ncbi:hypothetical protein [Emticicia sp. BO119]|uniref:hypothetical protein n=1 Tax=Emticicia sp. BO119 TaxID=2757768 RepID=UPI0015F11E1C|nr:hypothetical protein [Emticicia sp. BO119]MBA4849529.1 hypothetical protein [Emticicia sp. BO119]
MASSFNIDFPGTSNQFILTANSAITEKGGIFNGDSNKGIFSLDTPIGDIKGSYLVLSEPNSSETRIEVTITDKPFLVPMRKIESTIAGFLMK